MTKNSAKTGTKGKPGVNKSGHSFNPDRSSAAGGQNARSKSTIKRLLMYRGGKPTRNASGKITKAAPFQSRLPSGTQARVAPNRKWFGNTRVITQNALQKFQEDMGKVMKDPYQVVMKQTKLPITLLNERAKYARVHLLDTEPFENTFGKQARRKRPTLKIGDMQDMLKGVETAQAGYTEDKDTNIPVDTGGVKQEPSAIIFKAGQSKRIWNELYKVVDSSDVLIHVLDARDPQGTRCPQVEKYLKKEAPHKHLIFVLNKCDLVPTWATQKWVAILSAEYPTLAFHASITNPFGKGALIQLLRQFGKLHTDKKQISVGFIGYPNVGKSSVINTLRKKKVCMVAPIAGHTKVWQYVTLMRRIFLIDCPGVVYPSGDTESDIVLKGVVRVENVGTPEDYIPELLNRVKPEYLLKTYKISTWTDHEDFLEQVAKRYGKLLKACEPDLPTAAKIVLNDFQRGKIPYFLKPPGSEDYKSPRLTKSQNDEPAPKSVDGTTEGRTVAEGKVEGSVVEGSVVEDNAVEGSSAVNVTKGPSVETTSISSVIDASTSRIHVEIKQDYRKLKVEPEFEGNDVQELDEVDLPEEGTLDDTIGSEDSTSDTEDIEEPENAVAGEECNNRTLDLGEVNSHSSGDASILSDDQVRNASVLDCDIEVSDSTKGKHATTLKTTSGTFAVDDSPRKPSPVKPFPNRKRKVDERKQDIEPKQPKLTAKQRRAAERAGKSKKIGVHYYETANVKNRNLQKRAEQRGS
ncbi:uncharacterized protein [Watersipora subatra]|uniref:uncharacterized protein n=1 Tax=Watersipora subatra TaxID=2589382 RepID=UPI00355B48B6